MLKMSFDIYPLVRPFIFALDPEDAHSLAMWCLKKELTPITDCPVNPVLNVDFCGRKFPHPIGLAAGFDKDGDVIKQLFQMGFSTVEVGGVTPFPQQGNPRPRMFRLSSQKAVINRFGLNNIGYDAFKRKLQAWQDTTSVMTVKPFLGINIAEGDQYHGEEDAHVLGLKKLAPYVSYIAINVSCPNVNNACSLEKTDNLASLLEKVMDAKKDLNKKPFIFLKISPDNSGEQLESIAKVIKGSGLDAIIVSNTTVTRPGVGSHHNARETGGLSGKPLFRLSTDILGKMYQLTDKSIPLIGCGGVSSGADAYEKIRNGATMIQLYTAMVYEGPFVVAKILKELIELLARDKFANVNAAVGANFKK
ncbi:MAG: quinone-dependent dihydroorotate dehydrogenase [Alphaproteobacteria bacterium]|nr:quinone-dependent dihydroorotate dehydrogenase [Alphaproteobacteria bacterium]MCL2505728.1 quinone-dependent dihydroorotate dehydrogenase [Alphaproteobacteria bacterium]